MNDRTTYLDRRAPVAQAAAPNPTTFPFKRSGGGVTPTTEGRGVSASYALGFTPREPKFFAGHFERTDTGTYCTFMGCAQEAKRIGARWTIYAGTMYDAPDSGGGTYHPIPVVWVETAGVVAGYRWLPEGRDGDADFGHIRTDAEMHQDYPLRGLQWFATAIGEIVRDTNLPLTLAEAPNIKIGASLPHLAFLAGSLDDEYRRTMRLSDKDQAVYYAVSLNQREVRDLCIAVALSGEGHVITQRVERDSSDIGSSVLFAAEYLRPATPKLIWDAPKTTKSDAQVLADWDRDVLVRDWYATLQHIKPLSVAAARTEDARCAAIRAAALRVEAAMLEANCGVMESEARREIDALTAAVVVLEDLVNHGAKP